MVAESGHGSHALLCLPPPCQLPLASLQSPWGLLWAYPLLLALQVSGQALQNGHLALELRQVFADAIHIWMACLESRLCRSGATLGTGGPSLYPWGGALGTRTLPQLAHVRSVGLGRGRQVTEDQWLAGSILEVPLEWDEKRHCSQDLGASTAELGPKLERPWTGCGHQALVDVYLLSFPAPMFPFFRAV